MRRTRLSLAGLGLAFVLAMGLSTSADAAGRQYYSSWSYHPQRNYYYRYYYYKPTVRATTYSYHYCIYNRSTPRYVYYYNPHRRVYWGRFDTEGKPGEQYSLLSDENRKSSLSDIPESAFPKAAGMPKIPDAEDDITIEPPEGLPE